MAELDPSTERALRARILELETLVEARTQAIVGLGAQLAELRGDGPPVAPKRGMTVMRGVSRARRGLSKLLGQRG
jgi:hypothetical protein